MRGCDFAEGAQYFMESPQCLGYSQYRKVSRDLCAPPIDEIIKEVKDRVMEINAKFVFIATDNDPMISDFEKILTPINVSGLLLIHLNDILSCYVILYYIILFYVRLYYSPFLLGCSSIFESRKTTN